jgi:hypothetical protein
MEHEFFQKPVFVKQKKLVQVFPEVCVYSCSKSGEKRNFVMTHEYYECSWWKIKINLFESIKITCDSCHWNASIPGIFAKKVFKNGLKSHLVIRYSKSRIITSRLLNIWGSLWRVWLVTFGLVVIISAFRFYTEPVRTTTPKEISFEDVFDKKSMGKLVRLNGQVDYSLALLKDTYINDATNRLVRQEVYLPLFSKTNPTDFVIIKGGTDDVQKVRAREGITNLELLKNQDYMITGRLETVETIANTDLSNFFGVEMPKARGLNVPKVVVNSADVKPLSGFLVEVAPYIGISAVFLISSIFLQIYIDRKLTYK